MHFIFHTCMLLLKMCTIVPIIKDVQERIRQKIMPCVIHFDRLNVFLNKSNLINIFEDVILEIWNEMIIMHKAKVQRSSSE